MPTSRFDSRAVFLFLYGCTRLRFAKARHVNKARFIP